MRILMLLRSWRDGISEDNAVGILRVVAAHVGNVLRRRGVELVFADSGPKSSSVQEARQWHHSRSFPEADHAIIVEHQGVRLRTYSQEAQRVFPEYKWPVRVVGDSPMLDRLRQACRGNVGTFVNSHCIGLGMEDVTFYNYHGDGPDQHVPIAPQMRWIGWAADAQAITPRQTSGLSVLLDHPHYIASEPDDTDALAASLKGRSVDAWRLGVDKVEPIDLDHWTPTARYQALLPYRMLCQEYGKHHVFVVTHRESQGLCVLEAAMAGCLIVARRGYIKPVLLDPLEHVLYDDEPDWDEVFARVNPAKCRDKALPYNRWEEVGDLIYDALVE